MSVERVSPYRVKPYRPLFFLATAVVEAELRKALAPLDFLVPQPFVDYAKFDEHKHLVIAGADFSQAESLQKVAKIFETLSPLAYKVLYAAKPEILSDQHLLFGIEIGARFTVYGDRKIEKLREHLKLNVVNNPEQESLTKIEEEIERCGRQRDMGGLDKIATRLAAMDGESEDIIRLYVALSQAQGKVKKVEFFLKKALQLNPQSLWAANALGKFYLRNKQIAKGIEILEKMSQFQDLNSQRLLILGDAYLNCGEAEKAEKAFRKGDELNAGQDEAFKEGMGKAKLLKGDEKGAFALLSEKGLSMETISFLNMRGVMATKVGKFSDGLRFYETAIAGARDRQICSAKLHFNLGLAYVRQNALREAQQCFAESLRLGGSQFTKAKGPLQIVEKVLARKTPAAEVNAVELLDVEWETMQD